MENNGEIKKAHQYLLLTLQAKNVEEFIWRLLALLESQNLT